MNKNRYGAFILWGFLALACWGLALTGFLENRRGNQEFTLYYDSPVLTGKEMELFIQEREEEGLPSVATWKETDKESFTGNADLVRQGSFLEVRGEMKTLFSRQLIQGNFPWKEDYQGCVISRRLSQELFGTDKGIGNEIQVEGESYLVRGILKGEENLLAVWAEEDQELENFRLSYDSDLEPVSQAEEFLYQMTGAEPDRTFEGNLYGALSRFFLFLPILAGSFLGGVCSLRTAGKQREKRRKLFWYLLAGIFWLLFFWGLGRSVRLSPDYFPSMWSELSFYPQLIEEKIKGFRELTESSLCQADSYILGGTLETVLLALSGLFFEMLAAAWSPKDSWHFTPAVHRIKEKRI